MLRIKFMGNYCEIALRLLLTQQLWLQLNIGSGNGLVPSGIKPLSEPMLTNV